MLQAVCILWSCESCSCYVLIAAVCSYPPDPPSGRINDPELEINGTYSEGTQAFFTCDIPCHCIHPKFLTCQANGTWTTRFKCRGNTFVVMTV